MVTAKIVEARPHVKTGEGRSAKRAKSVLSFHSLRHTATSMLKNAGVSDSVTRDIIGHESAAVSQNYSHIDHKTKQENCQTSPEGRLKIAPGAICVTGRFNSAASSLKMKHVSHYERLD